MDTNYRIQVLGHSYSDSAALRRHGQSGYCRTNHPCYRFQRLCDGSHADGMADSWFPEDLAVGATERIGMRRRPDRNIDSSPRRHWHPTGIKSLTEIDHGRVTACDLLHDEATARQRRRYACNLMRLNATLPPYISIGAGCRKRLGVRLHDPA